MLTYFRGAFRFLIFFFVALYFLIPILIRAAIRGNDLSHALERRRSFVRLCSRLVGARIDVNEAPKVEGPCVYMSNHRSYFDPVAVLCDVKALPVAMAEVSSWPFIGFAARATGVMYVKRENRESRRRTVDAIKESLREGFSILIYPEGSTHVELKSSLFRQGAFRVAAELEVPVVPIAIEYSRREDAWVNNDPFVLHFLKVFGQRRIYVKMRYGQPLVDTDYERLVVRTQKWIDEEIVDIRRQWYGEAGVWEGAF